MAKVDFRYGYAYHKVLRIETSMVNNKSKYEKLPLNLEKREL